MSTGLTMRRLRLSPLLATALLVVIVAIALLRIADTYRTFNHTMDEPAHIGAAMQYLDGGTYTYELKHPPLRTVLAVGPWLLGKRYGGSADSYSEGDHVLYDGGDDAATLTAARSAVLPFFIVTIVLVFLWARGLAGPAAGLFAASAYGSLPLALAHAGLATNDTLAAATITAALFAWSKMFERPTTVRLIILGAATALAFLAKMSATSFLPAVFAVTGSLWLARRRYLTSPRDPEISLRRTTIATAVSAVVCILLVWSAYRFLIGPISDLVPAHTAISESLPAGLLQRTASLAADMPIPAPEFLAGFLQMLRHNSVGHPSFFLGSISSHGHTAFFPVAMLIKTPIPFLLLSAVGASELVRRWWRQNDPLALVAPAGTATMLAVCMASSINVGLRHLLPAFSLLGICFGVGAVALWSRKGRFRSLARGILIVLLGWQAVSGARAHPDYLAYFNECCDAEPEHWLIDSDLDWGQDLDRLAADLKKREVDDLYLAYFGSANPTRHALPPYRDLPRYQAVHGWVAISEWEYAFGTNSAPHDYYAWLRKHRPVARIGKSIQLYYIR